MSTEKKPKDTSWIRQSFLLPTEGIDVEYDVLRRLYTTSAQKFTDTTLGGNFVLNPFPQPSRYTDIRHKSSYTPGDGMGRWYSEVIDDNKQVVHFRVGVPRFNSLTRFFGDFYNVEAATLANKGRGLSTFFYLGKTTGTILSMGLQPILAVAKLIRFMINRPASRYYSLKPTMFLYWQAVSTMSNAIGVNLGLVPRVMTEELGMVYYDGESPDYDEAALFHKMDPSIYRADGGIDIFSLSTRAQRLADSFYESIENEASKRNVSAREVIRNIQSWDAKQAVSKLSNISIEEYMELYLNSPDGLAESDDPEQSVSKPEPGLPESDDASRATSFKDYLRATRRVGGDFVSFRVDHTGTQAESFSTSVKESGIASTINSMSSGARSMRFNMADGNAIEGAGSLVSAIGDFINGALSAVEVHGMAALAGSAFVDIPKTWDSSTADMNRTSLTIPLRSPYAHDRARFQNIIIPLCALVALSVPLSTGKQSYTSPFIFEMFNRGRTQIRLGMVESLSITRGVGDVGWTNTGKFLGCDVTLSIVDLSSAFHMPLQSRYTLSNALLGGAGKLIGEGVEAVANATLGTNITQGGENGSAIANALAPSTWDEDNLFTEYCAILGALSLESQINITRRMRLRMTQMMAEQNQWYSAARVSAWAMDGMIGEVVKAASLETARQ